MDSLTFFGLVFPPIILSVVLFILYNVGKEVRE